MPNGLLLCHTVPPGSLKPGDYHPSSGEWRATEDCVNGPGGTLFKPAKDWIDTPRRQPQRSTPRRRSQSAPLAPPAPLPPPEQFFLARLPEGAPSALELDATVYEFSTSQRLERRLKPNGEKAFGARHLADGQWKKGNGPDPWPLWREALAASADGWLLELEGEKCAEVAIGLGLVAISQPGNAHTEEAIIPRYQRLQDAGINGVVYVADADKAGKEKAERCQLAANAVGLPFFWLAAETIWPNLPKGGSIDDAAVDGGEWVAGEIDAAARDFLAARASAPAASAPTTAAPDKPRRIHTHELLPGIRGLYRSIELNVRDGSVLLDGKVHSPDSIGRLYLHLSSPAESWPQAGTEHAVLELAELSPFDPVERYLNGLGEPLPMEQWEALDQWLLGIDDPLARQFLPRFFIGAVARVFAPGSPLRTSPVLIGAQKRGKTTLGSILFGDQYWVEGLGDLSRDARMRCHSAWGVELSELDGITRRSDQESLKTFLTETIDAFRKPYGKGVVKSPRRFVFWGTANSAPLRDSTGATRFCCIHLPDRMLPLDWAIANRDALWARAVEQYRAGKEWDRESESERQAMAERNEEFRQIDPWADAIEGFLRFSPDPFVFLNDIFERLEVPMERRNSAATVRVRQIAEGIGWMHGRRRINGSSPIRAFWKPAPPPDPSEDFF